MEQLETRNLNLYIKVRRYEREADLVLQFGSLTEEMITDTALSKNGRGKILHFSSSKAAFASVDKSLFDVSWKEAPEVINEEEMLHNYQYKQIGYIILNLHEHKCKKVTSCL